MERLWKLLSHLGVEGETDAFKRKGIVLTNQISAILIAAILISFSFLVFVKDFNQILNALFLLATFTIVLVLNWYKQTSISRFVVSIFPSTIIFLPVVLGNQLHQISFIYFSFSILAFSVIPILVYNSRKEKWIFIIAILINLLALFFYDSILVATQQESVISQFYNDNQFLIKTPIFQLWLVIVLALLFLKNINYKYELKLNAANVELKNKNSEILMQLEEIVKVNTNLVSQQEQIVDQRNFIESKNAELKKYQDKLLDYIYQVSESKDLLAKKEAENKSILDALRQNFIVGEFDMEGIVTWVAPKTLEYMSIDPDLIIGQKCINFVFKIDNDRDVVGRFKNVWDKIKNGKSVSADIDLKIGQKKINLSSTFAPIFNEHGQITKVLAIAEDISEIVLQKIQMAQINQVLLKQQKEIKDQNEELHQQKEEIGAMNETLEERVKERTQVLEQKNKQLAEYAFINAHLLRSPVSSILGLINLLEYENLNKEERDIFNYLIKTVKQLDSIVFKINRAIQQNKEFDREFLRE